MNVLSADRVNCYCGLLRKYSIAIVFSIDGVNGVWLAFIAVTEQRSIDRPRARRLDKAERKAMLLRHAVAVFAHRGIRATHHTEIAESANVSEPAVFYYFPTREALVAEVPDEVARFFLDMGAKVHARHASAPQIFLTHLRKFANAVDTHPDYIRVLLEWSTAWTDELRPAYLGFHQEILAILTRTIRSWRTETGKSRNIAVEDEARVFTTAGYVLVHMKLAKLPTWQIERFIQSLVRDTLVEPPPVQRTRWRRESNSRCSTVNLFVDR